MASYSSHLLSLLVFLPAAAAFLGLGARGLGLLRRDVALWYGSLFVTVLTFGLGMMLSPNSEEKYTWIPQLGVSYALSLDGLSVWFVLLTLLVMPIALFASMHAIRDRVAEYCFHMLLLETAVLGSFLAADMFLFYVFWEVMLVPMLFIIGIYGGKERLFASMKFVLFTFVGSACMLVSIMVLVYMHKLQFGVPSSYLPDLLRVHGAIIPSRLLFSAFALAFLIKMPCFPLHTWLPDAHVQAPTAGSVILASLLLKLGGYGLVRIAFPLFPEAAHFFQPLGMALGATAVIYGAWVAIVQTDMKKLVAYSSVSHMGAVVLGLFALNSIAMAGSIAQMISHGFATGGLFLIVGMIYERFHTREIAAFGGLARSMPKMAFFLVLMTFASVALPGTSGFVGEFLILLGAWQTMPVYAGIAALSAIFGAVYMLKWIERILYGQAKSPSLAVDLSHREILILLPFTLGIFWLGLMPGSFFHQLEPSILKMQFFLTTGGYHHG